MKTAIIQKLFEKKKIAGMVLFVPSLTVNHCK